MEREYSVTWQIPLFANSPEEAARIARDIQMDPDNMATFYEVRDDDGMTTYVDLDIGQDK